MCPIWHTKSGGGFPGRLSHWTFFHLFCRLSSGLALLALSTICFPAEPMSSTHSPINSFIACFPQIEASITNQHGDGRKLYPMSVPRGIERQHGQTTLGPTSFPSYICIKNYSCRRNSGPSTDPETATPLTPPLGALVCPRSLL